MLHRMFISFALVLGLGAAACVEAEAPPSPAAQAVPITVAIPADQVADDVPFSLGPESVCSNTFCAGRPLQAVCYCPLGSGLFKASTCAKRCMDAPPTE
ncbi:MAG: hypothetical protein JNK64_03890 [Myxococcales bacterium]|nr:hypothetical protein [Myxococcales bacterium]